MNIIAILFASILMQCVSIINGDTDNIIVTQQEYEGVKNSMDFQEKVVLITGSSAGIGATIARLYCYLGAKVVITGKDNTRIKEVVDDCYKMSPYSLKPLGIPLDLTLPGNVERLVNRTITYFGKIDILVNCAGTLFLASIQNPNYTDIYRRTNRINEEMPVELVRLAAPYLNKTNGSIVLIASILARMSVRTCTAYSMSKNSIVAFTRSAAAEVGPNVKVNSISPNLIDGTLLFRFAPSTTRPSYARDLVATSLLKRVGVPMDIARIVIFLTSNLNTYLDGTDLG